jgi:hypothetical protein
MGCEGNVPPGGMCSAAHCIKYIASSDAKAYCDCLNWKNQPIPPPCQKKGGNEPTWTNECYDNVEKKADPNLSYEQCKQLIVKDPQRYDWKKCACCCSCYAWYTKIAVAADTVKFVQDFEVGDEVLVASVSLAESGVQLSWESRVLDFSDGTSPNDNGQDMFVFNYDMGKALGEIIVTNDQLLLTEEGKLKRADRFTVGENLVREDGSLSQVIGIRVGGYKGGIHHIATPLDEDEELSINGHLLSSNGVITGDYWTQVLNITDPAAAAGLLVKGHDDLPVFGSEAYMSQSGVRTTLFSAVLEGEELKPVRNPFFTEREQLTGEIIFPTGTRSYFTKGQAANISRAPHVPPSQQRNVANFRYLQQLFWGFYPDINLYMNWEDDIPNLHAFTQYGQQTVYISGRLLRTQAVEMEGLAALLGHGIAIFLAGESPNPSDFPCKAVADYYGLGYVLKEAFYFNWAETATKGYDQLVNLFGFIKGKNRNGDPKMPCTQPSINCRLQSLDAALSGFNIPACADGPQPGTLKLEKAAATTFEGQMVVIASFNEAVEFTSASKVTNYQITPVAEITTALRNDPQMKEVVLTVKFPDPPEGAYTLTVSDILSANGSTLSPDAKTATFNVKAPPAAKPGGKRRK